MTVKRSALFSLFCVLVACGDDATPISSPAPAPATTPTPAPGGTPTDGTGTTAPTDGVARVSGIYEVPVDASLAAAASYATSDIRWSIIDGEARLAYDLPASLVGKKLSVDFRGPFDTATGNGTLTGVAGTAECSTTSGTAGATAVSCRETMRGLLPIEVDQAAVQAGATADGASVADRVKVADQFAKDPIGIIHFDVPAP